MQQSNTWVPVLPGSAVQEMNRAIGIIQANEPKRKIHNMAQGAEGQEPPEALDPYLTFTQRVTGGYHQNHEIGGSLSLREAGAGFYARAWNIEVDPDCVFFVQTNGRWVLGQSFYHAAKPYKARDLQPCLLAPEPVWPMVGAHAKKQGLRVNNYLVTGPQADRDIREAYRGFDGIMGSKYITAAINKNYPHNPTSFDMTPEAGKSYWDWLENENERRKAVSLPLIMDINDRPYPMAAKLNPNGIGFVNGLGGNLGRSSLTPWIDMVSFSKFFRMHRIGTTMIAVHPSLREEFGKNLVLEGPGIGWCDAHFANMEEMLHPDNDAAVFGHAGSLHDRYEESCGDFDRLLGSEAPKELGEIAIPGGIGMPRLADVSKFIGQKFKCMDGITRQITEARILAEILLNQFSIATVPDSEYTIRFTFTRPADEVRNNLITTRDAFLEINRGMRPAAV